MIKVIHDILNDTYTEVELTKEELAARAKLAAEFTAQNEADNKAKAEADAAKQAVLDKLGLSADEVAALLG
jgi:hypothetical protein